MAAASLLHAPVLLHGSSASSRSGEPSAASMSVAASVPSSRSANRRRTRGSWALPMTRSQQRSEMAALTVPSAWTSKRRCASSSTAASTRRAPAGWHGTRRTRTKGGGWAAAAAAAASDAMLAAGGFVDWRNPAGGRPQGLWAQGRRGNCQGGWGAAAGAWRARLRKFVPNVIARCPPGASQREPQPGIFHAISQPEA